jgi:hypothetical protein
VITGDAGYRKVQRYNRGKVIVGVKVITGGAGYCRDAGYEDAGYKRVYSLL